MQPSLHRHCTRNAIHMICKHFYAHTGADCTSFFPLESLPPTNPHLVPKNSLGLSLPVGDMSRPLAAFAFFLACVSCLLGQAPAPTDPNVLIQKIQSELGGTFPPAESKPAPDIPRGEFLTGTITDSTIFPGTENGFKVYVPAQYDPAKPACLLIELDNFGGNESAALDTLIAKKELPVIIGVGISPGAIWKDPAGQKDRHAVRYNRSYEFDSMNSHFPDYVLNELLPAVEKLKTKDGRPIHISSDPNDRATMGGSTGGIGAFTLAWQRPDQFRRVYAFIGTFVSMRGGHEYPAIIRKTEPKPLRIFLEDGSTDAWNPLFGTWYDANLNIESALTFAGYDVAHVWGSHGHDGRPAIGVFPDVMRWLWRDYPAPIKAGNSKNSTLVEILPGNSEWQKVETSFQNAQGLAANTKGEVYLSDIAASAEYRLSDDGKATPVNQHGPATTDLCFGPDGTLFGLVPKEKKVVAFDADGNVHTVAEGIAGHNILVTHTGAIYISEPGVHSDEPSRIWQILPSGEKKVMDEGLLSATGIAFSPDGALFFAAENATKWIYSYVVQADGTLVDKQPFDWLHMTDIPNNSGAEALAFDSHGNLYVATRMGVQVCDQNGRVRAILPLPTPCGPVRSLCFGGEHFDVLYVTDGKQVFTRKLKVAGAPPWKAPAPYPSQGAG